MNALKNKWRSRRGASILLALLFLLICLMVGSSVLMAAASNAGKIKSNKEEQQKYLTLSSALELVCGKLEEMRYTGQYTYTVDSTTTENTDPEDESKIIEIVYDCTYSWTPGKTDGWELESVLPLGNYLDWVVSQLFDARGEESSSYTDNTGEYPVTMTYSHSWDGAWGGYKPPEKHTLYLTVEPPEGVGGGIADTVEITVEILSDPIEIDLTAALEGEDGTGCRMYARLESVNLLYAPEPGYGVGAGTTLQCGTLNWELKYLSKSKTEGGS